MPTGNPFFDTTVEVGAELFKNKQAAEKIAKHVIPFGFEPKPRPEQYRKRFVNGTPEFRQSQLDQMGRKGIYKLMGMKDKTNGG